MSFAQDFQTPQDTVFDVIFPPSDLLSDELPLETELHLRQMVLLIQCLEWWWRDRLLYLPPRSDFRISKLKQQATAS